jgi:hypothetical protein
VVKVRAHCVDRKKTVQAVILKNDYWEKNMRRK